MDISLTGILPYEYYYQPVASIEQDDTAKTINNQYNSYNSIPTISNIDIGTIIDIMA